MSLRRNTLLLTAGALLAAGIVYALFHEYFRATTFVIQEAGLNGVLAAVAKLQTQPFTEQRMGIPWRGGELPARWYSPARSRHSPILLVPGVHASGMEEPRLVRLARDLASIGHPVMVTELADLMHYQITPRSTDMIEDAAEWLSKQPEFAPSGRVGVIGISFAGGLSIVAASRPSLAGRLEFVLSFGGHGDLPRTLRYLCTGEQADGTVRPPHDYGVAIILLGVAHRVVPPEQADPLRKAILTFLEASRLDMVDKEQAQAEFARARTMADELAEPARTFMHHVNGRDVASLGPLLLPHISVLGGDPSLSPSRSPIPTAPVYLLHGADDNVIPAMESALLAGEIAARGGIAYHLATALVTHAEVDRKPTFAEVWQLVRFFGRVLNE
jgi:dienelactone hydrolase